jgi:hypothetical protein
MLGCVNLFLVYASEFDTHRVYEETEERARHPVFAIKLLECSNILRVTSGGPPSSKAKE